MSDYELLCVNIWSSSHSENSAVGRDYTELFSGRSAVELCIEFRRWFHPSMQKRDYYICQNTALKEDSVILYKHTVYIFLNSCDSKWKSLSSSQMSDFKFLLHFPILASVHTPVFFRSLCQGVFTLGPNTQVSIQDQFSVYLVQGSQLQVCFHTEEFLPSNGSIM